MSCCPELSPSYPIGASIKEANGNESDIRPGENIDCYANRAGNTTGGQDDATQTPINKIQNTSIPTTKEGVVNIQFRLTPDSTSVASRWELVYNSNIVTSLGSVPFNSNGLFQGTFNSGAIGEKFKIKVNVYDSTDEIIDSRSYTFSPGVSGNAASIQLISPLPGAIVNSKYGPRLHPILKVMKFHTGIDMKYQDGKTKDVVAAADGEVILTGGNTSTGYGLRVHIKHLTESGNILCITTYNHLSKIYVSIGQKVMAGQKIGLEGSTGASTGNHLHFECKLPNGSFVDPEPLIRGSLSVANKTTDTGDADPSSIENKTSDAVLSEAEVKARMESCEQFGPNYPKDPDEPIDSTPAGLPDDPFELAWYFTLTHEIGPIWMSAPEYSPTNPDIQNGLIDTNTQKRKVGYVNIPGYPGGETKFGIAQKPNPDIKVTTLNYAQAKNKAFNAYWQNPKVNPSGKPKLLSIMLFDMCYLHGPGNTKKILEDSGALLIGGTNEQQLVECEKLFLAQKTFIININRKEYQTGWLNRANALINYVRGL